MFWCIQVPLVDQFPILPDCVLLCVDVHGNTAAADNVATEVNHLLHPTTAHFAVLDR